MSQEIDSKFSAQRNVPKCGLVFVGLGLGDWDPGPASLKVLQNRKYPKVEYTLSRMSAW